MHEPLLTQIGLSEKEAGLYETLLRLGQVSIQVILKATTYKRGDLYNILSGLEEWGLVEEKKQGKKTVYTPAHPSVLETLLAEQQKEIAQNQKQLGAAMPELQSLFGLISGKPGIRYYEGKEGVIRAYEELLELNKSIDSIEDKGDMAAFIPEYFPTFIKKRVARGIVNRVVAPATNQINESSEKEKRETRTVPLEEFPFSMDVKICGNTVLLTTLKEASAVAVRIDHPEIAENFRRIFQFFWKHAARRQSVSGQKPNSSDTSLTVFNT